MEKYTNISYLAKLLIIVLILNPDLANSQNKNGDIHPLSNSVNLGIKSGLLLGMTDYINPNEGFGIGADASYFFSTPGAYLFGLGLSINRNSLSAEENNLYLDSYKSSFYKIGFNGIFSYSLGRRVIPLVKAGISYSFLDAKTNGINNSESQSGIVYDLTTGFIIPINNKINFNLEGGIHFNNNDLLDNIAVGKYNDFYFSISAGLSINLFMKKDSDNDQILDDEDQCPNLAEDFDGFEDNDGCPDYDNDFDNIRDKFDECPNETEDYDGFMDEDGCPDFDNDNDGIPDSSDICPDEAEDLDGFQDQDGCIDEDNDNDGIPDSIDECPNEPETFNNYNDDDGCPDEEPETEENVRRQTQPSQSVPARFYIHGATAFLPEDTGIRSDAYSELNKVVEVMRSYPNTRWRIEAHMDAAGDSLETERISQLRANAVLNYFLEKGISPDRLLAVGMGSRFPIAANETEYGRMRNRRVVIIRIR